VKAIVLVGGEGTRLRPLTYTIPKQMLPVVEVPMIVRVVSQLAVHGVSDVVLSLGYRPDAFIAAFPDGRCCGASVSYVVESEPLDTAGAIRYAAHEAGVSESFIVVNGDVLTDLDVSEVVAFHRERGGEGTISLTPVEDPSAFGVVPCHSDGRVSAFIEKPPPGTAPTNFINAGVYVLEPSVLDRIPADRRANIERETFPAMVADATLFATAMTDYWLDVGTPERYLQACADLVSGLRPGVPVSGAVEVAPRLWYLGTPSVASGPGDAAAHRGAAGSSASAGGDPPAELVGPSFLGDGATVVGGGRVIASVLSAGTSVAGGALVKGSVMLAGASVGAGAVVRDSIVGPGAIIGEGAHVGAVSVIGANVHVDAGAQLFGARQPV
jgi:mannose-1-phosphate guanylyltransferase